VQALAAPESTEAVPDRCLHDLVITTRVRKTRRVLQESASCRIVLEDLGEGPARRSDGGGTTLRSRRLLGSHDVAEPNFAPGAPQVPSLGFCHGHKVRAPLFVLGHVGRAAVDV